MIDDKKLGSLYQTIARDLKIDRFDCEDEVTFHNRLVYSAIGRWILQMFADRDFEEFDNEQISKLHVTLSAVDILDSYKRIDSNLNDYFYDPIKFVNACENAYVHLGYILSGNYSFKRQEYYARVSIGGKTLVIDSDASTQRTRGLGLWGKQSADEVLFTDFVNSSINALDTFKNIINVLSFDDFDSTDLGRVEIYNTIKNRWDFYKESLLVDEYGILKIDDGLDYKIIKRYNGDVYCASLPPIYKKSSNDNLFQHEVWRLILGLCAYVGKPATCKIQSYGGTGLKISFGGYIFPILEESILKAISWPLNRFDDINEYVTDTSMMDAINELCNHLSIEVIGEDD